jgi:hypothetical protein
MAEAAERTIICYMTRESHERDLVLAACEIAKAPPPKDVNDVRYRVWCWRTSEQLYKDKHGEGARMTDLVLFDDYRSKHYGEVPP